MGIIYSDLILRAEVRANPNTIYLFGDNIERRGFGGQAKEMRGEPNALGIAVKFSPGRDSEAYLSDDQSLLLMWQDVFERDMILVSERLRKGKDIVMPSGGIGTGRAMVAKKAPKCWEIISYNFTYLGIDNPHKEMSTW